MESPFVRIGRGELYSLAGSYRLLGAEVPRYNRFVSRMLPILRPMRLTQRSNPFDDPDWIFEIKYDGFRALAYIEDGESDLVSRKSHTYKSFRELREELATCV